MFFADENFEFEDEQFFNPALLHVLQQEFFSINSDNMEVTRYGLRSVPTHTEDGIPIRKIYVSNLPPKTTRTELFGVFAQYGMIKSCWLRMGERGPNRMLSPTYAFVTFIDPADAHKALQAPLNEKFIRGQNLWISPADSWHQPVQDADGNVNWRPRQPRRDAEYAGWSSQIDNVDSGVSAAPAETSINSGEASNTEEQTAAEPAECTEEVNTESFHMIEVLNNDCITHILSYVPVRDLIRSERVSKRWQCMVHEYLQGIRTFRTSWWQHGAVVLTTAVLRRVLQRLGGALARLHIDHPFSALNDRTAHTVGKFCPNLDELKIVGMYTKNWNPLLYGCKQLKNLSFISCNKLLDASLVTLMKADSSIESLTVANNGNVTGLFLSGTPPAGLAALAFHSCCSLQGAVLCCALERLPRLTALRLDVAPPGVWKVVPLILHKLPRLEELSLSDYSAVDSSLAPQGIETLCAAFATLTELKVLNLEKNLNICNAVLKQVAQSCPKLRDLNVAACNSGKNTPKLGVSDEGIIAVCKSCRSLRALDMSYLAGAGDAGAAAAAAAAQLQRLTARGLPALTSAPLQKCLAACHYLEELDVCGCEGVSEVVVEAAAAAVRARPRPLALWLAGSGATSTDLSTVQLPRCLAVDTEDDRSDPQMLPGFVNRLYGETSDDSLDDDHEDLLADFLGSDDDYFLEDELEDFDDAYALQWGLHSHNILLL